MAKPSGIYWGIGIFLTWLLVFQISVNLGDTAGIPWLGTVGGGLVLVFVLALVVASRWLVRGGGGPRVVGPVMVPLHMIVFVLPMLVHRGICRLRATIGPRRDLFQAVIDVHAGRLERAVLVFQRHLRRQPRNLAGLGQATLAFLKLAPYEDALRYLDAALSRNSDAELLVLRGLVLGYSGAPEDGLTDIEAALVKRPKNWMYHFYRAMMLVEAERVDDALAVLKGPASPTKCPDSWYLLSLAFAAKGDLGKAADACSRALPIMNVGRRYGPMPWNQTAEAQLLSQIGGLEEAYDAASRTAARNPGDHEALVLQAEVHCRRGETGKALQALERAAGRRPFCVLAAARDPAFAPLAATLGFAALLERATRDWEARLFAMRHRPSIAPSGA